MNKKKTLTFILSEKEVVVLDGLCAKKGLSKAAVLRQALRLYQSIDERLEKGEKIMLEDPNTKEKSELMVL